MDIIEQSTGTVLHVVINLEKPDVFLRRKTFSVVSRRFFRNAYAAAMLAICVSR